MPQTYPWDETEPVDTVVDGNQLGAMIRKLRIEVREVLNQIKGVAEATAISDPMVNGSTIDTLLTLTTEVDTLISQVAAIPPVTYQDLTHAYLKASKIAQSIAVGAATKILLDTNSSETGSQQLTLASNKITVPNSDTQKGIYVVTGILQIAGGAALTNAIVLLYRNGVAIVGGGQSLYNASGLNSTLYLNATQEVQANKNDYFELFAQLTGTGSFTCTGVLTVTKTL